MAKVNNHNLFLKLRAQYPVFYYEGFDYSIDNQEIRIVYDFRISDSIFFRPKISIPVSLFIKPDRLSVQQWDLLVFHLGMIELISYWKSVCSPIIKVNTFSLSNRAIEWWKKLYFNGLGEFFYLNSIQTTRNEFVKIECESQRKVKKLDFQLEDKVIVPIGGGKDSVVTLELLKHNEKEILPLIINPRGATLNTLSRSGLGRDFYFRINRSIDSKLLELNAAGYLNGHTPFSAMLAFYTLLASALTGYKNIALSNESSANESTVEGEDINHQYSKSIEFERDFREYVSENISSDFNYFSFLRPLSELQIAKLFSEFKYYFDVFKSCNAGSKEDIWCGICPKCMFANIILAPFLTQEERIAIFQKELFEDETLKNYFEELIGLTSVKPFECVGTVSEVNVALCLTIQKYKDSGIKLPKLLAYYRTLDVYTMYSTQNIKEMLCHYETPNFLNVEFETILKSKLKQI